MVMNGKLSRHNFDYLENISGRRLDPTLSPHAHKTVRADESSNGWVLEIMSKSVSTLHPNDSVNEAIKLFKKKGVHHIPLSENHILVGMVSDRDIMWLSHMEMDKIASVRQFMSKIIIVCHEETPIASLAHVFVREKINGMAVIDDDNSLVGMVTHHDLLRWIYDK